MMNHLYSKNDFERSSVHTGDCYVFKIKNNLLVSVNNLYFQNISLKTLRITASYYLSTYEDKM